MTLTDREKALVEAARRFEGACTNESLKQAELELSDALRAYDPPKAKVYALPEWKELTKMCGRGASLGGEWISFNGSVLYQDAYEHLRELTAKEQD